MGNSLYNDLVANKAPAQPNIFQQINDFKRNFSNIDPRAEVQRLLSSGQMTQEQFQSLGQMANGILSMRPRR